MKKKWGVKISWHCPFKFDQKLASPSKESFKFVNVFMRPVSMIPGTCNGGQSVLLQEPHQRG